MKQCIRTPISDNRLPRRHFRVVSLFILFLLCSSCGDDPSSSLGDDPSSSLGGDPITLLNYTEPTAVGIGGPLIVLFSVRPGAGIRIVTLDWRREGGEWQKLEAAAAVHGRIPFRHDLLGTKRLQFRLQSDVGSGEVQSAWITIDSTRQIRPVTLLRPSEGDVFSLGIGDSNVIAWAVDEQYPVDLVRISYRRDGDSAWTKLTDVDDLAPQQYVWPSPRVLPGPYTLRLHALGYEAFEEVRVRLVDSSALRILAPADGAVYYHHASASPVLRWDAGTSGSPAGVEAEYATIYSSGYVWSKLGTFDAGLREIPLASKISSPGEYRIRIRRAGDTGWTETGSFYLVRFRIALKDGLTTVRRGSPWPIEKEVSTSFWPACHEPFVKYFLSSDGGRQWERVDPYGDVVTVPGGASVRMRMQGTSNGIVLTDTTASFTVTEQLSEFFPAFVPGERLFFRHWCSSTSYGNTDTSNDTSEVQILSVALRSSRIVYTARKRFIDRADTSWSEITITEEYAGLHQVTGLPTGNPTYRYLDSDYQGSDFFIRTGCDPLYNYPRSGIRFRMERGIGLKYNSSGSNISGMSGSGCGCVFIRRE